MHKLKVLKIRINTLKQNKLGIYFIYINVKLFHNSMEVSLIKCCLSHTRTKIPTLSKHIIPPKTPVPGLRN